MRLRIKYFLYLGLLHLVLLALTLIYLRGNPLLFLLAELGIIISLVVAWHIYRSFIVPVQLMTAGAESLKEKDFSIQFKPVGQREMDALIVVYNRMIEQLRLERTYQTEQHFLLEKLIMASPAGILLLDIDGYIYSMNKAAERILGVKELNLKGKSLQELPAPFSQELETMLIDAPKSMQVGGNRFYRATKSQFIDRGFGRQFILLEELTREILRAEKGAYDKVIRMMSHEVNNSIGAINSILQSLQQLQGIEEEYKNAIAIAINRNLRLSKFMGNFADVVKVPAPCLRPVCMQELLQNMLRLLEYQAREQGVVLSLELLEEEVTVLLDKEQFEQVLLNVIKNAMEAARTQGQVKLLLAANGLRVLDNGNGIPPEVQARLFTPFYSNKPQGQGIGLMLVREILRNHDFSFNLHTQTDGWTEFRISW